MVTKLCKLYWCYIVKMHVLYLQSNKEVQVSYPWRQHAYKGCIVQFPVASIITNQHNAKQIMFFGQKWQHFYINITITLYILIVDMLKILRIQICSLFIYIVKYVFTCETWKSQVIVCMVNMMRGILSRTWH